MATYKVKKGETFSQVADKLGISEAELRRANKGVQTLSQGQGIRYPQQKTKGQAWVTGENEKKTVTVNGQQIRLGPNSSVQPQGGGNVFQQIWNKFQDNAIQGSGSGSVRGSTNNKGLNALASPVHIERVGGRNASSSGSYQTGEGETKTVIGPNGEEIRMGQNSTYTPTRNNNVGIFERIQNLFAPQEGTGNFGGVRGSTNNKGINGMASPVPAGYVPPPTPTSGILGTQTWQGRPNNMPVWAGGAFSYAPRGNYSHQAYTPMTPNRPIGSEYPNPINPFTAQSHRILQQGYYPIGSEYPNPITQQQMNNPPQNGGAPFMTSMQMLNGMMNFQQKPPAQTFKTGSGQNTSQPGRFGNYAAGNKLYSGKAKTGQEAFQQGTYKPGVRWWIGRNKGGGGGATVKRAPAIKPVDIMSINWRA